MSAVGGGCGPNDSYKFFWKQEQLDAYGLQREGTTNLTRLDLSKTENAAALIQSVDMSLDTAVLRPESREAAIEQLEGSMRILMDEMGLTREQAEVFINNASDGRAGPRLAASALLKEADGIAKASKRVHIARQLHINMANELATRWRNGPSFDEMDVLDLYDAVLEYQSFGSLQQALNTAKGEQGRALAANKLRLTAKQMKDSDLTKGTNFEQQAIEYLRKITNKRRGTIQEVREDLIVHLEASKQMLLEAIDNKNLAAFLKDTRVTQQGGILAKTQTYWVNSLLSGVKTHIVNITANSFATMYRPVENILGGFFTADAKVMRQGLDEIGSILMSVSDTFGLTKLFGGSSARIQAGEETLTAIGKAFRDGSGTILNDASHEATDLYNHSNAGSHLQSGFGSFLTKWIGKTVQAPTKALGAADEFFKQINVRSNLRASLLRKGREAGITHPTLLAEYVADGMDRAVTNGQLLTRETLYDRASARAYSELQQADPTDIGGTNTLARVSDRTDELFAEEVAANQDVLEAGARADQRAKDVTFQTALGSDGGVVDNVSIAIDRLRHSHPALKFIIPFLRTPKNVAEFAYRRTPLEALEATVRGLTGYIAGKDLSDSSNLLLRQLNSGDPDQVAEAAGRAAISIGTAMTFFNLAANQFDENATVGFTGSGPANAREREAMIATGWQADSFFTTDEEGNRVYHSLKRFEPFYTAAKVAVDAYEAIHFLDPDDPDIERLSSTFSMSFANNFTNKTYTKGISDFLQMLTAGDGSMSKMRAISHQFAGSFIPSAVASFEVAGDGSEFKDAITLVEAMKARTPWGSGDVAPRRNLLGESIRRHQPWEKGSYNAWASRWSPYPVTSEEFSDPVEREIADVRYRGGPMRYAMTFPGSNVKVDLRLPQFRLESGQHAFDRVRELSSTVTIRGKTLREALADLIKDPRYQALPNPEDPDVDNPKQNAISRWISAYRAVAKRQLLEEVPAIAEYINQERAEDGLARREFLR